MARWTGDPEVSPVLEAGDAWRERCFLGDGSIFTDRKLWTTDNLAELVVRYAENPILGTRDFFDKLHEQLTPASPPSIQLAAELLWFLHLFPGPSTLKPGTKREQVANVWSWSGEAVPDSPFLDDAHLHGVGNPGTAYFTHRPNEFKYLIRTTLAFKSLPVSERGRLLRENAPWTFMGWLDEQQGSDRRLLRGAILYFFFPDQLERNLSKDHKAQIYNGFKSKLGPDDAIKSRQPSLAEYDHAIFKIRETLTAERGSSQFDFYDDETKDFWFSTIRDASVKDFTSWMNTFLVDRGLQLNQPGRDLKKLDEKRGIDPTVGFWINTSFVTNKPSRWLLHIDVTGDQLTAHVPAYNRAGAIGYANTKGGDSGALAVRILPVLKLGDDEFQTVERWEWLLLLCFPAGLEPGSSGEVFDNFAPDTGQLSYLKREQPYIFAALLCLNSPDEKLSIEVEGNLKSISYREVTDALQQLIHVTSSGGNVGR